MVVNLMSTARLILLSAGIACTACGGEVKARPAVEAQRPAVEAQGGAVEAEGAAPTSGLAESGGAGTQAVLTASGVATRPHGDSPLQPYPDSPLRPHGDSPLQPYGDSPLQPYGDSPLRHSGNSLRALDGAALQPAAATAIAVIYSDLDAEVGPRIDGVVRSVHVEMGDAVRAGQVLAVLEDGRQLTRVASASAARDLARVEFERLDSLLQSGFVTKALHDEALYRLRMAEASLQGAEVELGYTRVVAPFAGVVTRRMTGQGRAVDPGQPMFRVTALRPLRALVRISEREARAIPVGSRAILTGDGGEEVGATVVRVSPAVDPGSGTVELLLAVPDPGPLRPGSGATVRFTHARSGAAR
jgi:RND family efflux transporter MFP subunit